MKIRLNKKIISLISVLLLMISCAAPPPEDLTIISMMGKESNDYSELTITIKQVEIHKIDSIEWLPIYDEEFEVELTNKYSSKSLYLIPEDFQQAINEDSSNDFFSFSEIKVKVVSVDCKDSNGESIDIEIPKSYLEEGYKITFTNSTDYKEDYSNQEKKYNVIFYPDESITENKLDLNGTIERVY